MTAPIYTHPFCAEHARAGAPYSCRNGEEATVLKWDCRDDSFPLVGIFGNTDKSTEWGGDGIYNGSRNPEYDLVMLPLGKIDGKPVFVGDRLEQRDRHNETWIVRDAQPTDRDFTTSRWLAPAKVYPQTTMTNNQLYEAFIPKIDGLWNSATANNIANAALRHACDAGQVVTKEDHEAALLLLRDVMTEVRNGNAAIREAVTDRIRAFLKGQL